MKPLIEVLENFQDNKNVEKVLQYCYCVPVVGFNNAKYDTDLLMKYGLIGEVPSRWISGRIYDPPICKTTNARILLRLLEQVL
jgi:hypothetical protein